MGHGTKVGQGEAEVVTKKDLLVRLQAPRFFVAEGRGRAVGQRPQLPQDRRRPSRSSLELDGSTLEPLDEPTQTVEIAAGGETARRLAREGRARGRGRRPHEGADRRGVRRHADDASRPTSTACSRWTPSPASIRPDQDTAAGRASPSPPSAASTQSRLEVRYSPTLAGAMVDALPYLVDYPYGCTEQTLNRFLPTVITQQILHRHEARPEGRSAKQAHQPQRPGDRRRQGARQGLEALRPQPGLRRGRGREDGHGRRRSALADMQLSDGGWGWFSGYGEHSSPHTTAVVVHGLQIARQNDVALPAGHARARRRLARRATRPSRSQLLKNAAERRSSPYKEHADDLDALVFMVLADAGVAQRRDARLPVPRPHAICPSTPRRCSAWPCEQASARRTSWR